MQDYMEITEMMRYELRAKRMATKLSYKNVAEILHVNWTTYRRLEIGATSRCRASTFNHIESYLKGTEESENGNMELSMRSEFMNVLLKAIQVYALVSNKNNYADTFKQELIGIIADSLVDNNELDYN